MVLFRRQNYYGALNHIQYIHYIRVAIYYIHVSIGRGRRGRTPEQGLETGSQGRDQEPGARGGMGSWEPGEGIPTNDNPPGRILMEATPKRSQRELG